MVAAWGLESGGTVNFHCQLSALLPCVHVLFPFKFFVKEVKKGSTGSGIPIPDFEPALLHHNCVVLGKLSLPICKLGRIAGSPSLDGWED